MAYAHLKPLREKAGSLVPSDFSGNPKAAGVAFASPFPTLAYTVVVDIETTGNRAFVHTVQNRTVNGFHIVFCADNITGLQRVSWTATIEGEE